MFEFVSRNKRWLQIVLLVLIVPPFALFGIDFYFRDAGPGDALAKIGDVRISEYEYSQALRRSQDRMREVMRENPDPSVLNSPQFKESVLNELVDRKVMLVHAHQSGMAVSDAELRKIIAGFKAFQDDSGRFSMERYQQLLRSQGITEQAFNEDIRTSVVLGQMQNAFAASGFIPDSVVERLIRIREQEREVSQVVFNPADYAGKAKASEPEAEQYYKDNPGLFQIPERVRIEYVILSMDAVQRSAEVTDDELRKLYEENIARYQAPEERRASHILVDVPSSVGAEDRAKAKALAEELLQQLKAAPDRFADLARKHSKDPGSAEKGGQLDPLVRGTMAESAAKPLEDAVFAIRKTGEIVGPVETPFGYHIVRLDGVKAVQPTPFEKVKADLAAEAQKAKAGKAYSEAAEKFNDLVYEQFDSLQPAADELKLAIQKSDWIGRAGGNANPLLNNEKLLGALFSDEVLRNKHNTNAIEVQPNMLLAARVIEHKPVEAVPFTEVRQDIVTHLTGEAATKLAEKEGRAALEKLRAGGQVALSWSPPQSVSLQKRQGLHAEGAQAVFGADTGKLPAYAGASAPQGRFVIYKVSKVKESGPIDPAQKKQVAAQLSQLAGQEQFAAYLAGLREKADVKIDRKKLEQGS